MKILWVLLLFVSIAVRAAFVPGTDVPLMDGLVVDENDSFSFDTPAGQIMTVSAQTTAPVKEVKAFYGESLPALGWQQISATQYHRDQDELSLQISSIAHKTSVKIQMTFANK